MLLERIRKNRDKRKKIAHIIAGVVILIHAYEKYEEGHGSYQFFLIAGFVFITVASLHNWIEKKAPWIDAVLFVIESILSFIIAYDFFHMGKKALPICWLVIAVFQLVMAFVKSKKGLVQHRTLVIPLDAAESTSEAKQ